MISKSILITGLAGISGYHCFSFLQQLNEGKTIGILPLHQKNFSPKKIFQLKTQDTQKLKELFETYRFDIVIDASGTCALKSCEYNPRLSYALNVQFGIDLAKLCQAHQTKLFRFSTDLIFSGKEHGNLSENSLPDPVTVYGKHMFEAEKEILLACSLATIFRISLPMGPSLSHHAGAIDWIESRFKKNLPATLYYDEIRSSTYVQDLVQTIFYFIIHPQKCPTGIFHLSGPLSLSLYQIAQIVNVLGNYSPDLLHGCLRSEDKSITPRAGNVSLNSEKIKKLLPPSFIQPWPLNSDLIPNNKKWHYFFSKPSQSMIPKNLYFHTKKNFNSSVIYNPINQKIVKI